MRRLKVRAEEESQVPVFARRYVEVRHQERQLETERKEVGGELLPMMQNEGVDKYKVDFDENTDATVKVKVRENVVIDPDRLKKALGAQAYNKLTTPMLDESKIEAAIKLGEVDPNVVASCTDVSETPYLEARFTKKRRR